MRVYFLVVLGLIFFVSSVRCQDGGVCTSWLSKIDPKISKPDPSKDKSRLTESEEIEVMECLLSQKGKKYDSTLFGATVSTKVSQTFGSPSVEVASLYYISYIFNNNRDHADAIALRSEDGVKTNTRKIISRAFSYYRKWLKIVKRIGIATARQQNLNPLIGSGVRWY